MTMKQLEVQIMGQSYLLGCPEGGDASLLDAVSRVDRDRIAVLAALNLAFDAQTRELAAAAALLTAPPVTLPVSAPQGAAGDGAARDAATADPQQTPGMTSIESARLLALIERLDTAFGDDGQLL